MKRCIASHHLDLAVTTRKATVTMVTVTLASPINLIILRDHMGLAKHIEPKHPRKHTRTSLGILGILKMVMVLAPQGHPPLQGMSLDRMAEPTRGSLGHADLGIPRGINQRVLWLGSPCRPSSLV